MKKALLLFITICISYTGYSQCPTANVTLSSQAEVNSFTTIYPGCTAFNYRLTIQGNDITDLSPLSIIATVEGLSIYNNPQLTNLNGLQGLIDLDGTDVSGIGNLYIYNNILLQDISALINASSTYPLDFSVVDNPVLTSLNGLQGIQGYGYSYAIINNDSLIDFTGFDNMTGMDDLVITDNASLNSFNGLENLNVDGTGSFRFINNDAMLSFTSLNNITPLCGFEIRDNANLADIDGFVDAYEEGCGAYIIITGNPSLAICNTNFVCNAIPYLESFEVANNAVGCNSISDVSEACNIAPFNDDCSLFGLPEITIGETFLASNDLATTSPQVPSCNDVNRVDVWYAFNSGDLTTVDIIVSPGFSIQLWEGYCSTNQIVNACGSPSIEDVVIATNTYYTVQVWSDSTTKRALGDFSIVIQDGTLSTQNNTFEDFLMYPNPVTSELNIKAKSSIESINIYSLIGKEIMSFTPNVLQTQIKMTNLNPGIYLINVKIGNQIATYKIVKE